MRKAVEDEVGHDEVEDEEVMGFLALQWRRMGALTRTYTQDRDRRASQCH